MTWSAKPLTVLHNAENQKEMARLLSEHQGESETIVRNERLLGQLIPLRAFGDVRFKWSAEGQSIYSVVDIGIVILIVIDIHIDIFIVMFICEVGECVSLCIPAQRELSNNFRFNPV